MHVARASASHSLCQEPQPMPRDMRGMQSVRWGSACEPLRVSTVGFRDERELPDQ